LAQGLKRAIGTEHMSEHDVTRILRIAYTQEILRQTPLYAWLAAFQQQLPAPVLA
jgi:hypothetical protein